MCLPGVEIVPRPRGSILHVTRASQRPYSAKSDFSSKLYIFVDFPLFPLLFPLKGPIGPGDHPWNLADLTAVRLVAVAATGDDYGKAP